MSKPLLIDTDVLIDYLREQSEAVTYIEGRGGYFAGTTRKVTVLDLPMP
jgi:hypothetical protein